METSSFKPFVVTGYPRSGTAWVANLLTTDRTSCIHEGSCLPQIENWLQTTPYAGISCPTAALCPWISKYRVLLITRDKEESLLAFRKAIPGNYREHYERLEAALVALKPEKIIPFSEVFSRGEEIWRWAYPDLTPNPLRFAQLSDTKIEQNVQRVGKLGLAVETFLSPDS